MISAVIKIYSVLIVALFAALSTAAAATSSPVCNVVEFGAIGDGFTYDTVSFEKAISSCSLSSSESGDMGLVLVPAGRYLLSPFNLSSNLELHLQEGAVLLATTDFSKWFQVAPFPSYPPESVRL